MIRLSVATFVIAIVLAVLGMDASADNGTTRAVSREDMERTVERLCREEAGRRGGVVAKRRGLPEKLGWGLRLRGAYVHQFDTDIDDGGRFHVHRAALQAAVSYSPKPKLPITVVFGYRYDGYRFDGRGLFGSGPWDNVHSLRATVPVFFPLGERWVVIGGASVRSTVEEGAPLGDGVTGGGFGGALYRFSDRLSIGPGFGILTEIEDSPSFFPILLIDWKITRTLSLKTGQGLGATQGPGLFLEWKPRPCWEFSLGGRYERNRFRLDDRGVAPRGIGEETSFAALIGAMYKPRENLNFDLSVGATFAGEVRLEDTTGHHLRSEGYDTAFFVGIGFGVTF